MYATTTTLLGPKSSDGGSPFERRFLERKRGTNDAFNGKLSKIGLKII